MKYKNTLKYGLVGLVVSIPVAFFVGGASAGLLWVSGFGGGSYNVLTAALAILVSIGILASFFVVGFKKDKKILESK